MFQYCFSTIVIVHTAKNEGEKEEIFFASSLFCNFRGDTPKKLIFNSACGKKKYATHFFSFPHFSTTEKYFSEKN